MMVIQSRSNQISFKLQGVGLPTSISHYVKRVWNGIARMPRKMTRFERVHEKSAVSSVKGSVLHENLRNS